MRSVACLAVVLWTLCLASAQTADAAEREVETAHLIVRDAAACMPAGRLEALAQSTQAMVEAILGYWSVPGGVASFGKIHVDFEPAGRGGYSSVFFWRGRGAERVRVVRVSGWEGQPQMLAHKLASALMPQSDKLIRNIIGIVTEEQLGNPLTFPRCGFQCDDWVAALVRGGQYAPLGELGPEHESWGMAQAADGRMRVNDRARQHRGYAEAGGFGGFLLRRFGKDALLRLQRLSHERARPWREVFGADLPELEAAWLADVTGRAQARQEAVAEVEALLRADPRMACFQAQRASVARRGLERPNGATPSASPVP